MAILAIRHIPGSTVQVELRSDEPDTAYYYIRIDGEFFDGDYCSIAEGIDRLVNPFNVKRVISQAEHYDAIDRDFEGCYSRT